MKKNVKELAAPHALGALEGDDALLFSAMLAASPEARSEALAFSKVTEVLALTLPPVTPSAGLKESILRRIDRDKARARARAMIKGLVPPAQGGLAFIKEAGSSGWMPLRVPGAFVKLLAFDEATDYAIVLGKLEPGSRYPGHEHRKPEDLFMLSGDLHIGDEVIQAGDFHHAEAGSKHGVNWSEGGCVLVAVLSKQDLLAQLVPD